MAVVFLEKIKIQKSLILVFVGLIIVTLGINLFGAFREEPEIPAGAAIPLPPKEVKIDFKILESEFLKELQPFSPIEPFDKESGRVNPFIPY